MSTSDEIFDAACSYYGTCIGSKYCLSMTVKFLMSEYDLSEDEAIKIADLAFKEWMDAYE
jgi:20S proteasome alpha/beta subunit